MKLVSYWQDTAPRGAVTCRRTPVPGRGCRRRRGRPHRYVRGPGPGPRRRSRSLCWNHARVGWGRPGETAGWRRPGMAIGLGRRSTVTAESGGRVLPRVRPRSTPSRRWSARTRSTATSPGTAKCTWPLKPPRSSRGMRKTAQLVATIGDLAGASVLGPERSAQRRSASDYYRGGLIDPKGAGLHVGKFVSGLATAAVARRGDDLRERPGGVAWNALGDRHIVHTSRGSARADEVLVATSGYTDRSRRGCSGGSSRSAASSSAPSRWTRTWLRTPAARPDGVGRQEAHLLLPADAGQAAALRRPRAVRAVQPGLGPEERADPA